MSDEGENVAEKLMGALITKMESMDEGLQILKAENAELKRAITNPASLLRKAGFVSARNRMPEDVMPDTFRGDSDDVLLKGEDGLPIAVPKTNADFHSMDWADIHALADQAKSEGAIGNEIGMD
tara:strand:+ start:239 stop:610 length:372 start_codon:yes stop_codon:yes gene_type:complete